ncbi:TPA: hypothetical protein UM684_004563 [Stenotrophomonas maltophilia]|uniref:hypothetical protein n=1 Tax=Stenotrophomonas maltophilia TaxID=40324 RepID=UPI00146482C8|nr:hypothetical protein [Stenotrophomonas maltophilia]MBH1380604.1 hypothetical protein [Stenotrophomonas maltophilia]MBH1396866.1 hypothetical protein [Stenotrophomonas maltophilia]MBH1468413.1 hypothetical protein [Stenotrophomonas maltophilia]MBH1472920.1 hypothetical protein [Stenotrophomonas maltophilia]QJP19313.1 hypothetical protein HKK60_07100 [Stenotrophomonas maltophilia]
MKNEERDFLQNELNSFVDAGISRMAHSGDTIYYHTVELAELKEATGRQRVNDELLGEYQDFFAKKGVEVTYDQTTDSLDVRLDLGRVRLNGRQSRNLTTAQDYFRVENGA